MRRTVLCTGILAAVLIGVGMSTIGRAQAARDPEAALHEINAWYSAQVKQLRESEPTADVTKLIEERKTRIEAVLKDVDPAKTEPAKCLVLAELYQGARQQKEAVDCALKYLKSNPPAPYKYTAHQILLAGYYSLKDVRSMIDVLDQMQPRTPLLAALNASNTGRHYAAIVAEKLGLRAGLELIDNMERRVPFDQLKTEQEKRMADSTVAAVAMGRAELYEHAGKKAEAIAALKAGVNKIGRDNPNAQSLVTKMYWLRYVSHLPPN